MIEVRDLTKSFGDVKAVQGISFTIDLDLTDIVIFNFIAISINPAKSLRFTLRKCQYVYFEFMLCMKYIKIFYLHSPDVCSLGQGFRRFNHI